MPCPPPLHHSLDPTDWQALRTQGHKMLDDMFDYLEAAHEQPVWQAMPDAIYQSFQQPLNDQATPLPDVHELFMKTILPYSIGNTRSGFMGWVHGGGTAVGMLAEMLAAGVNANLGGRYQAPIEVERQLSRWVCQQFKFPETAHGLLVSGTSMANFISVLIARTVYLGETVRTAGVAAGTTRLVAYTSSSAHLSIGKAMDMAGLGSHCLRSIPVNAKYQFDVVALEHAIKQDKQAGLCPFFIAATVGTVDVGAIDPLAELAALAKREQLWLHVDGAFGALAILSDSLAPQLQGIEHADSLAFDFHKWGQVPYSAGFVLIRQHAQQLATFTSSAAYLQRSTSGMAAGSPWPCDEGPELSRNFMALKVWFTLKVYGRTNLGNMIAHSCTLALYLKQLIEHTPELELLAPVTLNIVCYRYRCTTEAEANRVNQLLVNALQNSGISAPSSTYLQGKFAIRAALVNHRTQHRDIDNLLHTTLTLAKHLV